MQLRGVSVASTGHHALGFRAGRVRWAAHVPEQLEAGGVPHGETPHMIILRIQGLYCCNEGFPVRRRDTFTSISLYISIALF